MRSFGRYKPREEAIRAYAMRFCVPMWEARKLAEIATIALKEETVPPTDWWFDRMLAAAKVLQRSPLDDYFVEGCSDHPV